MSEVGIRLDIQWSCPTCTFINKADSFKCSVCGTLKGTATRQVKYHLSTLEQQYMSETLQSNRIQTARALSKLQAQSQSLSSSSSIPSSSFSSSSSFSMASSSASPSLSAAPAPTSSPAVPSSISQSSSTQDCVAQSTHSSKVAVDSAASCAKHSTGIGGVKKKQKVRVVTGLSNHRLKLPKWPRLKNINRSHVIRSQNITVNNVTVTITEHPLLYPDSE